MARAMRASHHVQGEHHAAGGRPEHHAPDGGTGLGMSRPAGWPDHTAHGHHLAMPGRDLRAAWARDLARPDFQPGGITSHAEAFEGSGSAESRAGEDRTGQSGGTMVSNMIPAVV